MKDRKEINVEVFEDTVDDLMTYNIVRNGKTESVDIVLTKYDTVA